LVAQQDWQTFLATIRDMRWGYVLLAAGLVLVTQILNTTRWYVLLRAIRLPISWIRSAQLFFAGLYVSNFLPTTIGGDVLRLSGIAVESEDRVKAGATVVIDRLVSLAGMALLLPFSLVFVLPALQQTASNSTPVLFLGINWLDKVRPTFHRVWNAFSLWKNKPVALLASLCVSLAGVLAYLISLLIVAHELDIQVILAEVAGVTGLTYFLTLLPISMNGWGIREVGVVAFYTALGAGADQAVALALVSRAMLMLSSLPGAIWVGRILERITSHTVEATLQSEDA
jgi:hypothetical protein